MEVSISGKWVPVHKDNADDTIWKTEDGVELDFDIKSGQWNPVASAGTAAEP